MDEKCDWFENWFDTTWYHTLYRDRDYTEGSRFIENLIGFLKPTENATILDLACGKGRHAKHINRLGYRVWGVDLSSSSIESAIESENENLRFSVHDMRMVYKPHYFNYIFNLFTSFGYFNNREDNLRVMESVCEGLKPNGIFVLDFLNANKVKNNLVVQEKITKEGIEFSIKREVKNNIIQKNIDFESDGKKLHFEERVTAFELEDLIELFAPFKLKIEKVFGDYNLEEFNAETSNRLILVARKGG
jgi:SAM-dependent methyltransferase